ncbi:MAG: pyridoxal 5'-phosphate synthase glutaminase subunit PdxT [Verrucomicrobiota bacterium]
MTSSPTIGVLDLQGGVAEHFDHFARLEVTTRRVKHPEQIAGLGGLVIPGGESTCLRRLLTLFGFEDALRRAKADGMKFWGTCAGAILLADDIVGEEPYLGMIDISVQRNAFGSQLASFRCSATVPAIADDPLDLTFIRAPKIVRAGPDVEILLRQDDYIAAAESEQVLVTAFHPELSPTLAFHRHFARKCGIALAPRGHASSDQPSGWSRVSWMRHARAT